MTLGNVCDFFSGDNCSIAHDLLHISCLAWSDICAEKGWGVRSWKPGFPNNQGILNNRPGELSINYSKVGRTCLSCLEAHAGIFRLSMKGKTCDSKPCSIHDQLLSPSCLKVSSDQVYFFYQQCHRFRTYFQGLPYWSLQFAERQNIAQTESCHTLQYQVHVFTLMLYPQNPRPWIAWPHFWQTELHSPPNGDFCPRIKNLSQLVIYVIELVFTWSWFNKNHQNLIIKVNFLCQKSVLLFWFLFLFKLLD